VYALKIASSVCEGLHYAHQRSDAWGNLLHIVHRDVTPENVFVSFDGTVKILDFGIAKARGQTGETTVGEIKEAKLHEPGAGPGQAASTAGATSSRWGWRSTSG
jgi:serine/threonine protein kinase